MSFRKAVFILIACLVLVGGADEGLHAAPTRPPPSSKRPTVALVLSGGGARGGAHIGVLKRLEEAGIPIDLIAGTSFGALVGGLYSVGYSASDIELILKRVDWNELLDDSPDRRRLDYDNKRRANARLLDLQFERLELKLPTGLQPGQKIRQFLDRLTALPVLEAKNDFDRLPVRFRAVATDILTGQPRVFARGSMGMAVRASLAVPGLFTPVEEGDTLLVDGGLADNLPVEPALAAGADLVIAVDVSTPLKSRKSEISSVLDILDQAISVHIEENKVESLQKAQIVISPDLKEFGSADFTRAASLVDVGYRAASESLPVIEELLRERGVPADRSSRRAPLLDAANFDLETFQWSERRIVPDAIRTEGLENYPKTVAESASNPRPTTLREIDEKVATLYGSDLFTDVAYRLTSEGGDTILTYEFAEASRNRLGLGIRYDRDYNFTGHVDLISRDFLGTGSDLSFLGRIGEASLAQLRLDAPTVSTHRLVFSPRLYFRRSPRSFFDDGQVAGEYFDERLGFLIGGRYLLGNRGQIEAGYQWDRVHIVRASGEFSQADAERLARLRLGARLDTLDDYDLPSVGFEGRFQVEASRPAFGSDYSFTRLSARGRRYLQINARWSLGVTGDWGLVDGAPPFYERFYIGGAHYLDVSAERFVGLRRDELVADHFLTVGLSLRRLVRSFQLGFLKSVSLQGEYQAGIFSRDRRLWDFRPLLHGAGGGIVLDTRFVGPILVFFGATDQGSFNTFISLGRSF